MIFDVRSGVVGDPQCIDLPAQLVEGRATQTRGMQPAEDGIGDQGREIGPQHRHAPDHR